MKMKEIGDIMKAMPRVARIIANESKERVVESFRARPIYSTMKTVGCALLGTYIILGAYQQDTQTYTHDWLYAQVRALANTDHDNATSAEEWARAYSDMGLYYDARDPAQLSTENLKTYLRKHHPRIRPGE